MPFPFPISERVVYRQNPLAEVICQLRFPPILRIEAAAPADFQERVRSRFPLFEEAPGFHVQLPAGMPGELQEIIRTLAGPSVKSFTFTSEDGVWKLGLSREAITLSCYQYERWEAFREQLRPIITAFETSYEPTFYSRIGLRYQDVLDRSALGLNGRPWADLLQPHIAAQLSSPEMADAVREALHDVVISLPEFDASVHLRHGLNIDKSANESRYTIDADFYTEKRSPTTEALRVVEYLHNYAGDLFRWCIKPDLHHAMEPQPA